MNLKNLKYVFVVMVTLVVMTINAQERFITLENKLKELSKDAPGLNEKIELSVNGVSIQDFVRGIATANNLNVSVDASLNTKIINNFSNVSVADVLLFLCKKYDLDIVFIGNIMSITPYITPIAAPPKYAQKVLKISYNKTDDLLNLDLYNDSLALVAKELTKASEKNVVFSSDLAGKMISGYIQSMPYAAAMDKLAFANDLKITPTKDNFYLIEKTDVLNPTQRSGNRNGYSGSGGNAQIQGLNFKVDANKLITIDATNTAIADILSVVSKELKVGYFLFTEPKGNTSLNIANATYDDFLNFLFNGTDYTFKKDGDIYMIGDRNLEGLRSTKIISLKYRTVEKMIDFIPADLKKGIDIKIFTDLNSLIVSGSQPRITELEAFLRDVDRVVPVISIEVIILDVRNSSAVSTGLSAGLGKSPTPTGGSVYPGVNMDLGAGSINSIIDGLNGTGIVNLGKVTPNFYVNLKLLETNGSIKINSTPLLATLNGHEAKMNISETRYYFEQNTNVIAGITPTSSSGITYKPLTADFSLIINPIVSGDEQITLDINVKKQSFTEATAGPNGQTGPYGNSSRDFQSLIRVKNQEMVMLGGLDEETKDESGSGVPLLSRIPVIKWIFSARSKKKNKSKLTIFIKPTVIY